MTDLTIPGFTYDRVTGAGGTELNVAHAGQGSPVVLLHGFPQTHLMWSAVAQELSRDHTVIAPDLRGYGDSDKPDALSPDTYSKRTMADDVVTVVARLGHDRFAVVGHDRGALVAVRAGLDHPETITHVGILDVLPTMDTWDVLHGVDAKVAWHLYLMAQPPGLPEKMIGAVAGEFFASFLDAWDPTGTTFSPRLREHYITASSKAVPSIVADYRATASVDLEMDRADRADGRRLTMPVAAISQDWGSLLGFDPTEIWGAWAPDFTYEPIDAGHFMAEEDPARVTAFVRRLLARQTVSR
ncbi:alpha/beta hydrolase [Streptosporangium sp. NPDC000239]|uniref:alpha/beta fold hydrolase n=1 Tax=Streptosporangium sp. NPDC000239 TaxID=3154248 RepID=UPI003323E8EC